jgi:hypothetical protein
MTALRNLVENYFDWRDGLFEEEQKQPPRLLWTSI